MTEAPHAEGMRNTPDAAVEALGGRFAALDLTFHRMKDARPGDVTSYWPGGADEDVMMCAFTGADIHEPFHRQDFFFINYAWRNAYQALSEEEGNLITIGQDECYIAQPYSGYALRAHDRRGVAIVGALIRRDAFYREFLPTIYADSSLFRFFVEPQTQRFADQFIHLPAPAENESNDIRTILGMMCVEYADKDGREDSQVMLKSLLTTLLLVIARRHRALAADASDGAPRTVSEQILSYMGDHSDVVTLQQIAVHFGYNPNYISTLIHQETGRTFTQILTEKRMERAVLLLRNTTLTIDEIAAMLGYTDKSAFHRAFKARFGVTPREYAATTNVVGAY